MSNVDDTGGIGRTVDVQKEEWYDDPVTSTESGFDLEYDYTPPTLFEQIRDRVKWRFLAWLDDPFGRRQYFGDWAEIERLSERLKSLQEEATARGLIVNETSDPVTPALKDADRVGYPGPQFQRNLAQAKRTELIALEQIRRRALASPDQDDGWVVARLQHRAHEVSLQADIERLSSADRERVTALLATEEPTGEYYRNISAAMNVLYKHHLDTSMEAVRSSLLESQLRFFLLVVVLCLGSLFGIWAYFFGEVGVSPTINLFSTAFIGTVVLFGALGAAISSLMSLSSVLNDSAIPERVGSRWLAVSRVTLGAASALILYVFVLAELVNVFVVTPSSLLAIAFVGGFTERLLVRAVNAVGGDGTARRAVEPAPDLTERHARD